MNKILVEVSIGELMDKISILDIKKEKIAYKESIAHIDYEYKVLKKEYDNKVKSDIKLEELYTELKNINLNLWEIEDKKRLCEKKSDFGESFIKLSREIHFMNDKRADIKLKINNHTNSKVKEIKKYTKY